MGEPSVDVTGHERAATQAPSLEENEPTPRSEQPSVAADTLPATLLTPLHPLDPEASYFSPQPLRPYSSALPRSPVSSAPDPLLIASTLPSPPTPSPPEQTPSTRPLIHRDISSASATSDATVCAGPLDAAHKHAIHHRRDGPIYPNQSYAALHLQQHPTAHNHHRHNPPIVRSRTTHPHPAHSTTSSLSSISMSAISDGRYRDIESGLRTMGNSPVSSSGLFDPSNRRSQSLEQPDNSLHSAPWLHHTHRQAPKETYVADVQADPATGRKIVNQYEIVDELGRGVHGKVKLGREGGTGRYVAIKIVERYSKRRRLGKNTSHEDKIKREIAILKKARHPNIVSLLEVIDDPAKKKVYIVLEHVELGEIKWRTEGAKEICLVEWRRFQRESQGIFDNESAVVEDERIIRIAHQKLALQQRRLVREASQRSTPPASHEPWSLEFGIESSEEDGSDAALTSDTCYPAAHFPHRLPFNAMYTASHQHEANMETAFRSSTPERQSASSESDPVTQIPIQVPAPAPAPAPPQSQLQGNNTHTAYDRQPRRGRMADTADGSFSYPTDVAEEEEEIPEHFHWVPLMTFQTAWEAFKDTVLGIEYLHYQNVIHRDIKPANLLVTKEHRIKMSDFGVSYLGRPKTEESAGDHSESDNQEVDEAIELAKTVGTPAFYAPELCRNDIEEAPAIDGAIDIWALGVTLYCLIYGHVPFHDTNTFALMRVISEEDPYIPRHRLKPVAESSTSRPSSRGQNHHPFSSHNNNNNNNGGGGGSSNKRARHDLEYEEVDENLRDLLRRLLIKDARYRITIPDIKRHPWVLSGINNYDAWVEETDPSRSYDGRRIEISKDDVEQAVVPIGIVERIRKKAGDFFSKPFSRTPAAAARRRAQSSATNQEPSLPISTHSSSSTISQDGRRGSIAPGAILEVLGRSREADHPLSFGIHTTPDTKEPYRFLDGPNSRTASPAQNTDGGRPILFDRALSSAYTIRPTDFSPDGPHSPHLPPALPGTPVALDFPGGSHLSGLFGGLPRRVVNSMRSRDRLKLPKEHLRAKSIDRLIGGDDDAHAVPSLAISNTTASGLVDQPDIGKDLPPVVRESSSTISELYSPHAFDANSRQSSRSSLSSRLHRNWTATSEREAGPALSVSPDLRPQCTQSHRAVMPSEQEFNPARRPSHPMLLVHKRSDHRLTRSRDEHVHHPIASESNWYGDGPVPAAHSRPPSSLNHIARPFSRGGEARLRHQRVEDYLNSSNLSSENSPVGRQERGLAFSSSEEQFTPMSHSASNPSIPSVLSIASADSSAPDEYPSCSRFGGIVTTASADSISGNQFEAPMDDPAGYDGDHAVESEGDDDSEDDALFFGKRIQAPKPQRGKPASSIDPTRSSMALELSIRRRSARSGSNGTVKKIAPAEETAQQNLTPKAPR